MWTFSFGVWKYFVFGWVSADLRLIHGEHAALGKDGANLTDTQYPVR